jgi:PRA1 family protein 1
VPSWGRPPGAKGSKRRRRWEQEQEAWQKARVEELDSDDTDTQGVGLNFEKNRVTYDPLHFAGTGLSSTSRARKGYTYDKGSSDSDSEESEDDDSNAMQIALRDKEEALVQSALARIRRAQEKGKSEVKLNPEELEALERRRKRMQASATQESRGSGSGSGSERRRRSDRQLISVPIEEPPSRKKGKSKRPEDSEPRLSGSAAPPGLLVAGAEGVTYAPLGYYPPQSSASRNSPTRPRSATSQQLAYQQGQSRHYPDGTRPASSSSNGSRRPLPDEEDWVPNSRRSSLSSQSMGMDPFEYQVDSGHPPPIPQQYIQGRRIVSGSPEIVYSSLRRSPPSFSNTTREPTSDSALRRKGSQRDDPESIASSSEDDDDEDESDDLGNGVQVFVEEREATRDRARDRAIARKPVGGRKKGKGR